MSVTSMVTARLMETWAHGQDVADALGATRIPTDRLRHIAHLGFRTRDFAYAARGLTPPASPFRVELVAPDGSTWAHGPEDASDRVSGSALDFCLLVTQRRHRDDVDLVATGDADEWWGSPRSAEPGAGALRTVRMSQQPASGTRPASMAIASRRWARWSRAVTSTT